MVKKTSKTDPKILELENNYKRVLADYQNQQRRHQEMSSQLVKMASASLIEKLLITLDSLQLAQDHLKDAGLQIVIDQFNKILESEGLQVIDSNNKSFDPLTMDCTEVVDGPKDQVIETISKGYTLFDKVLRPARVKVGNTVNAELVGAIHESPSVEIKN